MTTSITFGTTIGLGGIIARLERENPDRVLPIGFDDPHSFRGYYDQLAFEPRRNIPIGNVLRAARSALGSTYEGYKGGEYKMSEWTTCWIANYGESSDNLIGPLLLELLLAQPEPTNPHDILDAVELLTKDTDGGDIDPDADIPVGEIRLVIAEARARLSVDTAEDGQ